MDQFTLFLALSVIVFFSCFPFKSGLFVVFFRLLRSEQIHGQLLSDGILVVSMLRTFRPLLDKPQRF